MDDLIIIGAGWAGMTAAALALEKGAKVRVIAQGIGSFIVTPGWISIWEKWERGVLMKTSIENLIERTPTHPYALAGLESLDAMVAFFVSLTQSFNLEYNDSIYRNRGSGASHIPRLAPETLIIGFEGWRDYYPIFLEVPFTYIKLPLDRVWDATPTDLARAFDDPDFRARVAEQITSIPNFKKANTVALPAVIGLEKYADAIADLESRFGMPIIQIPTLPPSVPGTRLFNKLRRHLLDNGVRVQIGHPVTRGIIENGRVRGVEVASAGKPTRFDAKAVILATGGLYGGGLLSDDRGNIWEPIFGLPVQYDPDRTRWFNENLLDPRGHPVHYFGVRANDRMQPIDQHGDPVLEGLYVAGQLLAHPNVEGAPLPSDTTEGVALATAYKAVMCALENISAS